jgi:glycosyltransferase involved in cell wall biosynthesis
MSGIEISSPQVGPQHDSDAGLSNHAAFAIETEPLVSIIIPCYNCEAFLQETIESALAQSYDRVEIIVVDDGSTDRSPQIARGFPVLYIRQSNHGLTASRNLGIRESRGSYVVFLDADDRLRPEAIETGLRVMAEHPECAMAVGDHLFVSQDGSHLADSRKACLAACHYEALLKSNFIEMISSVLFRRSVLVEIGGFDTGLRVAEDYELYLRIARTYPIRCHTAVIAEYRMHQANASHNSELMLSMTLGVLRREGRYLEGDATRRGAFRQGIRAWRKRYGRHLASELAATFSTLAFDDVLRKVFLLIHEYPQGLFAIMFLRSLAIFKQAQHGSKARPDKSRRSPVRRVPRFSHGSMATRVNSAPGLLHHEGQTYGR